MKQSSSEPLEEKPFLTEEDLKQMSKGGDSIRETINTLHRKQISSLESELKALREERDKAQEFKTYVHKRLDDMGIEKDPESPHKEKGCRIGGRLDIIEELLKQR